MNMTHGGRLLAGMCRGRRAGPAVAAMVAVILAAAGCGDSSSSPNAGAPGAGGGKAHSTGSVRLVDFAKCMRSHGLANFPDPTPQGTFHLPSGMATSPQFQSADRSCRSLAPAGSLSGQGPTAQMLSKSLKFAKCMQKNGMASFPDPSSNGTFHLAGGGTIRINVNSPQFKKALSACRSLLPAGAGMNSIGG